MNFQGISRYEHFMQPQRARARAKWISIVGARPQFVKVAPLCRAVEQHNRQFRNAPIEHQIVHTGQHYDREVAGIFFEQMKIPAPKHNLGVGSGSHGTQLARMLARMEPILCSQKPDWVLVYGDTNSTLAGALLAARLNLPLAHVEAGCRSGDHSQPEEQNRIVVDHLSHVLFVTSDKNAATLHREGIGTADDPLHRRVVAVGDILLDALVQNSAISERDAQTFLGQYDLQPKSYFLLTLHRAENTDNVERLHAILKGVASLEVPVLFPVHPRTQNSLAQAGIPLNGNLKPVAPLGYFEMLAVQKNALKILTDSGGVQREAFYLRVPCITLRDTTEWVETVEVGANRLVAPDPAKIRTAALEQTRVTWKNSMPYGDGKAAQRIVEMLHTCIQKTGGLPSFVEHQQVQQLECKASESST
jgi:UDP-N-acetylglucosamine 2-epimerase